jgi:hypothetical protein
MFSSKEELKKWLIDYSNNNGKKSLHISHTTIQKVSKRIF